MTDINTKIKKRRTTYSFLFKLAAANGYLPRRTLAMIPKSTLHDFKQYDYAKVKDLGDTLETLELAREIAECRLAKAIAHAAVRVKNTIINLTDLFKNHKKNAILIKNQIVSTIQRVKDTLGFDRALRYFKISRACFYSWVHQTKTKCLETVTDFCPRNKPNQLTKQELNIIKKMTSDKQFKGWPVSSIAAYALKTGKLYACLSTWYKYCSILGIKTFRPKSRRKKSHVGIRADKPNEIWHADVTLFRTLDNQVNYICIIIDNFSRYILGWDVSKELSALVMKNTLKRAYEKYIKQISEKPPQIMFMTDGGSENKAEVLDYINQPDINIKKIIAQIDVKFSNSMVESFNSLIKYRSLYLHDIPDHNALIRHMTEFIPVYNNDRPHYAHKYLTPEESYFGMLPEKDKFKTELKIAHKKRIELNSKVSCPNCDDKKP